jgi:2,5-diamino-6-(ribosylamino)-4(3H)-pyrimidinone 5'-phosphate reductase
MTTLDGKIDSGVEGVSMFDEYFDLYVETEEQLNGTSWMCGRVTVQEFTNFTVKSNLMGYMFAVDTKGVLKFGGNALMLSNGFKEAELVVILLKSTPTEYLDHLKDMQIKYIVGGEDEIVWEKVFKEMKSKYGVERLLLEGGGVLNGSVLEAGFIDEVSLILTPQAANSSSSPSLFGNTTTGVLADQKFKIQSVEKLEKDCVWIRYKYES